MQILNKKIKTSLIFYKCSFTGKNEKILKLFSRKITDDALKVHISVCENDLKIATKKCLQESNLSFIVSKDDGVVQNLVVNFAKENFKKVQTEILQAKNFVAQKITLERSTIFLLPEEALWLRESLRFFVAPFIVRELIIKSKMLGKSGFKILKHKPKATA